MFSIDLIVVISSVVCTTDDKINYYKQLHKQTDTLTYIPDCVAVCGGLCIKETLYMVVLVVVVVVVVVVFELAQLGVSAALMKDMIAMVTIVSCIRYSLTLT